MNRVRQKYIMTWYILSCLVYVVYTLLCIFSPQLLPLHQDMDVKS